MRLWTTNAIGIVSLIHTLAAHPADMLRSYIQNEDSHPHQVASGNAARFYLDSNKITARMDVKCSLEGDNGKPLAAVTLRTHGLTGVQWPYPARTIRVEERIVFDIVGQTQPDLDSPPYYEFVNEDRTRALWHQCYNN